MSILAKLKRILPARSLGDLSRIRVQNIGLKLEFLVLGKTCAHATNVTRSNATKAGREQSQAEMHHLGAPCIDIGLRRY